MAYKIISVKLDTTKILGGNEYKVHLVTYQGPPYQGKVKDPVTRHIFTNSDVAKEVVGLAPGMLVEVEFDDTKYKNPIHFTVMSNSQPTATEEPLPWEDKGAAKPRKGGFSSPSTDERIARAVALKEAAVSVGNLMNNGGYTAANLKKREFIIEQIIQTAREFLPFLKDTETLDMVDTPDAEGVEVPNENFSD